MRHNIFGAFVDSLRLRAITEGAEKGRKEVEKMKYYKIKPEYLEYYGPHATENTIISETGLIRLAHSWDKTLNELYPQLEEIDPKYAVVERRAYIDHEGEFHAFTFRGWYNSLHAAKIAASKIYCMHPLNLYEEHCGYIFREDSFTDVSDEDSIVPWAPYAFKSAYTGKWVLPVDWSE